LKTDMEVSAMKVLVSMNINEFGELMKELGYELWEDDGYTFVFGRVTYTDGDLQDWQEVVVKTENGEVLIDLASGETLGSRVLYGTNRSVPGWRLCPTTGEWMSEQEYEERCDEDPQPFYVPERLLERLRWKASHIADAY